MVLHVAFGCLCNRSFSLSFFFLKSYSLLANADCSLDTSVVTSYTKYIMSDKINGISQECDISGKVKIYLNSLRPEGNWLAFHEIAKQIAVATILLSGNTAFSNLGISNFVPWSLMQLLGYIKIQWIFASCYRKKMFGCWQIWNFPQFPWVALIHQVDGFVALFLDTTQEIILHCHSHIFSLKLLWWFYMICLVLGNHILVNLVQSFTMFRWSPFSVGLYYKFRHLNKWQFSTYMMFLLLLHSNCLCLYDVPAVYQSCLGYNSWRT